jgi:hypothetical protein
MVWVERRRSGAVVRRSVETGDLDYLPELCGVAWAAGDPYWNCQDISWTLCVLVLKRHK